MNLVSLPKYPVNGSNINNNHTVLQNEGHELSEQFLDEDEHFLQFESHFKHWKFLK